MYVVLLSFSGLLEGLCYTLYDMLRPVVIHINHLETLAELCSILKVSGGGGGREGGGEEEEEGWGRKGKIR